MHWRSFSLSVTQHCYPEPSFALISLEDSQLSANGTQLRPLIASMSQNVGADMAIDIPNPAPQVDEIPIEQLELELQPVYDGQVQLSELLSRMVQGIYTELTEMAET